MTFFHDDSFPRRMPRGRPASEDAGSVFAKQHRLARAALRVAKARGLAAVSARSVAREAGMSRAAIHHWFESFADLRADILLSLHDDVPSRLDATALRRALATDRDALALRLELLTSALRPGAWADEVRTMFAAPRSGTDERIAAAALDGLALHALLDDGFPLDDALARLITAVGCDPRARGGP